MPNKSSLLVVFPSDAVTDPPAPSCCPFVWYISMYETLLAFWRLPKYIRSACRSLRILGVTEIPVPEDTVVLLDFDWGSIFPA